MANVKPIGILGDGFKEVGNATDPVLINEITGGGSQILLTDDVKINGDLTVDGDMIVEHEEHVNIGDNFSFLNYGYTTAVGKQAGLVVNYLPTATTDTVAATGFTAGVAAVSNPTVNTVGAATFAVGDLIQITSANDPANNGLFEVLSHAANLLTIRGVGTSAETQDFVEDQFATDTTVAGTITKVTVSVIGVDTSGDWQVGKGSTTTGWTSTKLELVGGVDMQDAYDAGPGIGLSAANPIDISNAGGSHAIRLQDDVYQSFGTGDDASVRYDSTDDQLEMGGDGASVAVATNYITRNANESITKGDVVYVTYNTESRFALADADAEATSRVVGISLDTASAGNPCRMAGPGSVVAVNTALTNTADVGKPVYLSTTSGALTLTPPSGSGQVKIRVGFLVTAGAAGVALVQVSVGDPTLIA